MRHVEDRLSLHVSETPISVSNCIKSNSPPIRCFFLPWKLAVETLLFLCTNNADSGQLVFLSVTVDLIGHESSQGKTYDIRQEKQSVFVSVHVLSCMSALKMYHHFNIITKWSLF